MPYQNTVHYCAIYCAKVDCFPAYILYFCISVILVRVTAVFKQYKGKELPTMHCAFVLSICDILLNPKSSGIKCNDKSVVRRINAFLVNIHSTLKLEN